MAVIRSEMGSYSGWKGESVELARNEAELDRIWAQHSLGQLPPPQKPPVDFSRERLVMAFLGMQNSGGSAIEITNVEKQGDDMVVTVRREFPDPSGASLMAFTSPWHYVIVPAFSGGIKVRMV